MSYYELEYEIKKIIIVHKDPPLLPLEASARGITEDQLRFILELIAREWNDGYRKGNLDATRLQERNNSADKESKP